MPPKKKKVKFPFTNAQLAEAGLVGEGLSAEVRELIEHMRTHPEYHQHTTLALLKATNEQALHYEAVAAARADPSALSTTTDGSPYAISEYERLMYYQWQGKSAGTLLYRSDLHTHPFPHPPHTPPAMEYRSGSTAWRDVWDTDMHTRVNEIVHARGIRIENSHLATFLAEGEAHVPGAKKAVVWVKVTPGCTTAEAARDTGEEILTLLEENGVPRSEVTVEFCEGYSRRWGAFQNYVAIHQRPSKDPE